MQRITVLCVGKLKEKFYADAAAEYIKRLSRYCKLDVVELPETRLPEDPSPAEIQKALAAEANAIRQKLEAGAVVAMCIEGKQISSDELAQFLAQRAGSGAGDVAFVIGSSHGLSDEVKKAAALKFSMGRITMPHQLARLVLTEQIYRACTINAGMKYHK